MFFEGLNRGTLVVGRPGTGKTVWAAMQAVRWVLAHPNCPMYSLDASGSFTNDFIEIYHQLPREDFEKIDRRVVYDRLGDPNLVVPMPFFSPAYGQCYEEQVQRVAQNFQDLAKDMVTQAPIMSISVTDTLVQMGRLLCAIQNEQGECWQMSEAKKLLLDAKLLKEACKLYGHKVPDAKWYFEKEYLSANVSRFERELRTYALRSVLNMIEPRAIRARIGYCKEGWTPKEGDKNGLIVLVSGEELINQEQSQAILFTDIFSQIFAHINKRIPHDPNNKPTLLVIDEVPMLLKIDGMAEKIARISPQYRSRKLQPMVIIQGFWQLADILNEAKWSFGNNIIFGIEDHSETYETAQQLARYNPTGEKLPAKSRTSQPVVESDRGQYLTFANWLQHLGWRECIMKRYITESQEDPYIRYIERTADKPNRPLDEPLAEIKERLLKKRAIPVKDALEVINQRRLHKQPLKQNSTPDQL